MFHRIQSVLAVLGVLALSPPVGAQPAEGYVSGADGVRLYYRVIGHGGDTAIVLHGGPGLSMGVTWPDLEPLADRLTIVLYDQRGAGRSQLLKDSTRLRAADHVRDLEALRQHFRLTRMTLIGQSWGAGLAILYAGEHPEHVKRMLLVGPMPPTAALYALRIRKLAERDSASGKMVAELIGELPWAVDPAQICRRLFTVYFTAYFADRASAAHMRADPCDVPPDALRNFPFVSDVTMRSLGGWDFTPVLRRLQMPVLVVDGAQSFATADGMHALAGALPNGRLLLIPEAGHYPQIEQPGRFFPPVEAFLHGVWPVDATVEGHRGNE